MIYAIALGIVLAAIGIAVLGALFILADRIISRPCFKDKKK